MYLQSYAIFSEKPPLWLKSLKCKGLSVMGN